MAFVDGEVPLITLSIYLTINKGKRLFFEYGDLTDQNSLDLVVSKVKPDYVFHLAAQSYPQTSFNESTTTYNTNILGTSRLLES